MLTPIKYSIVFLVFACAFANAARFEQAHYNYHQKQFTLAIEQFKELAALGNKEAQFYLGLCFFNGEGTKKNHLRAYAWFKLAASKGEPSAKDSADQLFAAMNDAQKAKAIILFNKLEAEIGDKALLKKIHPLTPDKGATVSSYEEIIPIRVIQPTYPYRALQTGVRGSVDVNFDVGMDGRAKNFNIPAYTSSLLKNPALEAARKILYGVATENGNPVEQFDIRHRFNFIIESTEIKHQKVYKHIEKLKTKALKGSSLDRYKYAQALSTLKSYVTAEQANTLDSSTHWYTQSAMDGLPQAKYKIGLATHYGQQCKTNKAKSHFWMESAAKDNLPAALIYLGMRDMLSDSPEQVLKGVARLKQASDLGDARGKLEYARALALPKSAIPSSIKSAVELVDSIKGKNYLDPVSLYETRYLVYTKANQFKKAKKTLKKLKKLCKKYKLSWTVFESNLRNQLDDKPLIPFTKSAV